jgi:hypothetical protein
MALSRLKFSSQEWIEASEATNYKSQPINFRYSNVTANPSWGLLFLFREWWDPRGPCGKMDKQKAENGSSYSGIATEFPPKNW